MERMRRARRTERSLACDEPAKGDKDPGNWYPPLATCWCTYSCSRSFMTLSG
ncbi:hypothetical protein [Streptomyces sp. NPDC006510]|uniref:hypothetical protein n=1 Tax=Streptomyces sp. NPDC006510 TaxID=3155600 RepID=UPI0033AA1608